MPAVSDDSHSSYSTEATDDSDYETKAYTSMIVMGIVIKKMAIAIADLSRKLILVGFRSLE